MSTSERNSEMLAYELSVSLLELAMKKEPASEQL